ncbi:MAG: class I SAM-dependent methyltransferase [Actinomycetota bacterium]|nr:class I SAM-dependent methyltransferase [Actinomycetota bacterium]
MGAGQENKEVLREEFNRAAGAFSQRTKNRFDKLGAVEFSQLEAGGSVLEVGAGTGNFLRHFGDVAGSLVALDLTPGMLEVGRADHPSILPVLGDGARLPFRSRSFDLVTSAQTLHHVRDAMPFLREMRRVVKDEGSVVIVDQVATERYEEIAFRDQLEVLRDPSHAVSRAPSSFLVMIQAAGMSVIEERILTSRSKLSEWMWPGEYPVQRIDAVRDFIERFGHETGMEWEREGDDWSYTRRRLMVRARR